MSADEIREALRCGQPRCECARPRGNVHCPAHDDEHPSLGVDEKDGKTLVHDFSGRCTQEEVIEALRARGLWRSGPPTAPALSRLVRRGGKATLMGPLVDVLRFVRQYVVLPSQNAEVAVALWVAHCWVFDAFDITPYLLVRSAEKRSGKSRLLTILTLLLPKPWLVFSPSEAVLFRRIARDAPQVLLDESDPLFNGRIEQHEPLRALLNAGFERGAVVPRCVGEGSKIAIVDFPVFCPKAVAVIGSLPDTIEDRSIVVAMKRATPAEQRGLGRFRRREAREEAAPMRESLARWAEAALPRLRDARPAIPDELDGRAADLWEILLSVAEEAGDGWAVAAWKAALALSGDRLEGDQTAGVLLLSHVREVFAEREADRLTTTDLLRALVEREDGPWAEWWGKAVAAGEGRGPGYRLARMLKPYDVRRRDVRTVEGTKKGYYLIDFQDAFSRYLPPNTEKRSDEATTQTGPGFQPSPRGPGEETKRRLEPASQQDHRLVASFSPQERGEEAGEVPEGPCPTCGRGRFWQRAGGPLTCATCHPPAPGVVAQWWVRRGGRWLRLAWEENRRWQVRAALRAWAEGVRQ